MSSKLTDRQKAALELLRDEPRRGFDLAELARKLETSPQGAAMTMAALVRRGDVVRFSGGVGRQRTHYIAKARVVRQYATSKATGVVHLVSTHPTAESTLCGERIYTAVEGLRFEFGDETVSGVRVGCDACRRRR